MLKIDEKYDWSNLQHLCEASLHEDADMAPREQKLLQQLIDLLTDDGNGHYHQVFAKRLKDDEFVLNIIPKGSPMDKVIPTAAISWESGIIYINQGILPPDYDDPMFQPEYSDIFKQMSMLIRHEMSHTLLCHEIRMMKHLSSLPWSHISMSQSIQEVLNIIMDFEISNKEYSAEDKEIVHHTYLNGEFISGLVTEDHRENWISLSVEEMYDKLIKELEKLGWTGELPLNGPAKEGGHSTTLEVAAAKLTSYKNLNASSFDSVEDFYNEIKEECGGKVPEWVQKLFDGLKPVVDDPEVEYTQKFLEDWMKQIYNSRPIEGIDLLSPEGEILVELYSPEEKNLAMEIIKLYAGYTCYPKDYAEWYQEVMNVCGSLSETELKEIMDELGK